ncbi:hypothetical protein C8J56DRAFT_925724 [Mycena floridula]|nr:hypothetical protein C8J56DRAFT_925724 [Mycena floridula]
MNRPQPVCTFFNKPGGCNKGDECRFRHSISNSQSSGFADRVPSVACNFFASGSCRKGSSCTFRHDSSSQQVSANIDRAPSGFCNFYWTTGSCKREFNCRFKHERSSPTRSPSPKFFSASTPTNSISAFLTQEGLAKLTGSGTDAFFSSNTLSPTAAHNALKSYLRDDFPGFVNSFQIYTFLDLIRSSSTTNTAWSSEEGQFLLASIATGKGLDRLAEVLKWESVSIRAGSSTTVLSFQQAYIPLLQFLSSDVVVRSTLNQHVNGIYMIVFEHFDEFALKLESCMEAVLEARSFKDPHRLSQDSLLGSQAFVSMLAVFFEIITRIKNAAEESLQLIPIVRNLKKWLNIWMEEVVLPDCDFDNPFKEVPLLNRDHLLDHLKRKIARLMKIVDREHGKMCRSQMKQRMTSLPTPSYDGLALALSLSYEGPGDIRVKGRRHDNDFVDIDDIQIAPTQNELICEISPYLPANFHAAPHHLLPESMERLLDIQFRLSREELTAPLRTAVQLVWQDLSTSSPKNGLSPILNKRGGRYRGPQGRDSVRFNVYTGVEFSLLAPDRRGLSVVLSLDAPPGRARLNTRAEFWKSMSGKRLTQGALVALIWKQGRNVEIYLGLISNSSSDLINSTRDSADRLSIRVVFFDPVVPIKALNALNRRNSRMLDQMLLIEAPVMYESVRPFLEALRVEPESIPFGSYLVHRPPKFLESIHISPPQYARIPGFSFQLASLFPPNAEVDDLQLDVSDKNSIAMARAALKQSRLDPSQVDAVLDTLTRELVLIQGPPGTGKSFTGVEILRVLLDNNIGPVLMIAFTNHALDHLLTSVLDAGITKKVARLGSAYSCDEKIAEFSIENMEKARGRSRLDFAFDHEYRELKEVEEEIKSLMDDFRRIEISSTDIMKHMKVRYQEHHEHLTHPPDWVVTLRKQSEGDDWTRVGRQGKHEKDDSLYSYWLGGRDLQFLEMPPPQRPAPLVEPKLISNRYHAFQSLESSESTPEAEEQIAQGPAEDEGEEVDEEIDDTELMPWEREPWPSTAPAEALLPSVQPEILGLLAQATSAITEPETAEPSLDLSHIESPSEFFAYLGLDRAPIVPRSDRFLDLLKEEGIMWSFSLSERQKLHGFLEKETRETLHTDRMGEVERLKDRHARLLQLNNESRDENRLQILRSVDIVGCTTNGAAKLTTLLKSLEPRVMLVEEAGQVLEAHILASLVPSVQHLILIGDPLQLRPTLNNYSLSMDNRDGAQLYKFDMSLMERLSSNGLTMSQINVQRRMRPAISGLIRRTLYPNLKDHDLVTKYPDVRGFAKNVFFFSHHNRDNGSDEDSDGKYNLFEVNMIKDLVLYLLKQGCYSQEGDIVILCAYLGQLAKVRDALANEVAVIVDERDNQELADRNAEDSDEISRVEYVKVSKKVKIRTVDNFQGEEAKIVILSLVRNDGDPTTGPRGNIGFLRSENRANVALSRAKEGLFILGNAPQMAARSQMWREIVQDLEEQQCVGSGFPVSCHQHPETVQSISKPGVLARFAPDGGCLQPCNARLSCGHVCSSKCHPDDPQHRAVTCFQNCTKLCARDIHPCGKACSVDCGKCLFKISGVRLPCGHTSTVSCFQLDDLSAVRCNEIVERSLPNCEHLAKMKCTDDPSQESCNALCRGVMPCCGRNCNSRCSQCQLATGNPLSKTRTKHSSHPCKKLLYCAHYCSNSCSEDHACIVSCAKACRQQCIHSKCQQLCSTPCTPCTEPCTWNCQHFQCPVPCGSACIRLPCDQRCDKRLKCGHQCPSVCGEDCTLQQCPVCASTELKAKEVDLIMGVTLGDIPHDASSLSDLIITLQCAHTFTVETLDGVCSMNDFYVKDEKPGWSGLQFGRDSSKNIPPVCPTCRAAITSPRYGRVFKSADLDVLEKNVISRKSQAVSRIRNELKEVRKLDIERGLKAQATKSVSNQASKKNVKAMAQARRKIMNDARQTPAPVEVLNPENHRLYNISSVTAKKWRMLTLKLTKIYIEALKVAETRSAHLNAWEASFSQIYRIELDSTARDSRTAPRNPQQFAMQIARMKVGQLQPRADKRFLVEAFWVTIRVRFILGDLVQTWTQALNDKGSNESPLWAGFGYFLLGTCQHDAEVAYNIAKESESRRQMTISALFMLRATLEAFRFNVEMVRQSRTMAAQRLILADTAKEKAEEAEASIKSVVKDHIRALPQDKEEWIKTNFIDTIGFILVEWKTIERSLRAETFYAPVSLDEKMAIVGAFKEFTHTGHWYNCPNGHAFVITECGGAIQTGRCPECGANIGGTNHNLDATNTRATDLEEITRAQGAQQSPWPWGR